MKLVGIRRNNKYRIRIKNRKINKLQKYNFKKKKNYIKKLILIVILFCSLFFMGLYKKKIKIAVDISRAKSHGGGGPIQLQKGINKVLPYENKYCRFIPVDGINLSILSKINDYYYLSYPFLDERSFNISLINNMAKKLLLGPCFVPSYWKRFPNPKYWTERKFRHILQTIKAVVVHSIRVRDHLASRANSTDLLYKFIILRPCTYLLPKEIKTFTERRVDIILFEKYADYYHGHQGSQLYYLFKNSNKTIRKLRYGTFRKNTLISLANDAKFIIYFSFYDSGAIALKEIQNFGVITFAHQKDFNISNKTSYYIPELEYDNITIAFNKIMKIVNDLSKHNPDSIKIANINQNINKCEMSLEDLCNGIINNVN